MAENTLSVNITANTTDLRTKLAVAQADFRAFNAETRNLATQLRGAGDDMKSALLPQLEAAAAGAGRAQIQIGQLKNDLKGIGNENPEGGLVAMFDAMKGRLTSLRNMGGEFKEIGEAFIAAFAVEKIAEFVEKISEMGAKVEHLSQQLGMSAEEISTLSFAAGAMGMSVDEAGSMLERLENNMTKAGGGAGPAAAAFHALGISAGELKSMSPEEALNRIAEAFKKSADGPSKTAIAMALMGRAGAEMIPILNQGASGLAEFQKAAQETGTVISGPMAEGMEKTAVNSFTLKESFQGIYLTLYEAFKPALDAVVRGVTDLDESFNSALKETGLLHDVLSGLVITVDLVVNAFAFWSAALQELWQVIAMGVEVSISQLGAMGKVVVDLFHGNFSQAVADASTGLGAIEGEVTARAAKMKQIATDYKNTVKDLFSNINGGGVDTTGGKVEAEGDGKKKLDASGLEAGAGKDRVSEWRDQLQQRLAAEGNFFADSKREELAYWQNILATENASAKERIQVDQQIFQLRKQLALEDLASYTATIKQKQQAEKENYAAVMADEANLLAILKADYGQDSRQYQDELKRKEEMARAHAQEMANIALTHEGALADIAKQNIDSKIDDLQSTSNPDADQIEKIRALKDEEYEIDRELAVKKLALEGQTDAQISADRDALAKLDAAHLNEMAALNKQSVNAQMKDWNTLFQGVTRGFDQMLTGVLQGTQTFSQLFRKLGQDIIATFAQIVLKKSEEWAAGEIKDLIFSETTEAGKTAAAASGTAARNALGSTEHNDFISRIFEEIAQWLGLETSKTAATSAGVAARIPANTANIALDAGRGAAAAFADSAELGPEGLAAAPAVAAGAYATIMGFAVAEKGFDVPAGINPMTQLHAKEMVLPARYADVIRGMANDNNASGRGSDVAAGGNHYNDHRSYNVGTKMSRSEVEAMLREHSGTFERHARNWARNRA